MYRCPLFWLAEAWSASLHVNRAFWRKLCTFPGIAAILIGLLITYPLFIACLMLYAPIYLRLVTLIIGCALIYSYWRAKPNYGRSWGWPPGSLALAPLNPWLDHLFYQKQAAQYGAIFKMSNFVEPMVCLVGLKQAVELLRSY
jgi:hypothetical protein